MCVETAVGGWSGVSYRLDLLSLLVIMVGLLNDYDAVAEVGGGERRIGSLVITIAYRYLDVKYIALRCLL